jgi:hypothetical protein
MNKKAKWLTILALLFVVSVSAGILIRKAAANSKMKELKPAVARNGEPVPVLVELFTSEGCSSCPPADQVLTNLMEKQPVAGAEIITLAEHVDYWNRLGWTDPYSTASSTQRQYDYAELFGGDSVYTPQMVVDGKLQFVGSDLDKARESIARAADSAKASVHISRTNSMTSDKPADVSVQVRIDNLAEVDSSNAQVILAVTESKLSSNVTDGENAGHKLLHSSVVRNLSVIGQIDKDSKRDFNATTLISIDKNWKKDNLRLIVFLQDKSSHQVLGASALSLK